MSEPFETVIESVFAASDAGQIHFGQVIEKLSAAGVISCVVDYRSDRITCYSQNDMAIDIYAEKSAKQIGNVFDPDALKAAIRGAQEGRVKFPEFKALSRQAGCIGYTVWIAGQHVTYLGRKGETHVEHFPS